MDNGSFGWEDGESVLRRVRFALGECASARSTRLIRVREVSCEEGRLDALLLVSGARGARTLARRADVGDSVQIYDDPAKERRDPLERDAERGRGSLEADACVAQRDGRPRRAGAAHRGIEAGDEVVTIPVGPGLVLVERVGFPPGKGRGWRGFLDSDENPLRGLHGGDPQAYVDELRGPWPDSTAS
jgi:hypothetical protein